MQLVTNCSISATNAVWGTYKIDRQRDSGCSYNSTGVAEIYVNIYQCRKSMPNSATNNIQVHVEETSVLAQYVVFEQS